ncbi:MAG: Fic family protein [Flavobacteriales bacterium]|nr:Fic family protein [Flavobacteriales bacterium]
MERELLSGAIHARLALDGNTIPSDHILRHLESTSKSPLRGRTRTEVEALLEVLNDRSTVALDTEGVKRLHRSLVKGSEEDDRPGQWRLLPTGGRPFEGVPPEVVGLFTEELCDWLKSAELAAPADDEEEGYAIIRMLLAELYLSWIRPFTSAHARLAVAVGSAILRVAGMPVHAAQFVSIAFHRQARELQRQVQHASEGAADTIPFMAFALRGMTEVLHEFHERIRNLQMRGQWRAQLLDLFQEGNDEPTRRQRQVLLDLASAETPTPLSRLDSLSPTLAKLYAGVSEKTLRRDVDALLAAGVVQKGPDGLRVDLSNLLAFKA